MSPTVKSPRQKAWSPIGLDLGGSGVRAMQLRRDGDAWVVSNCVRQDFPTGESGSNPALSASTLQSMLKSAGFRGRNVVLGIGPPDVEFHPLEISAAVLSGGGSRAEQVVRDELERVSLRLDGPMESRFWALPPPGMSGPTAMGVAANRAAASRTAGLVHDAGFVCRQLAVAAGALANVGYFLGAWEGKQIGGVLDLGLRQSRLIVCAGGEPVSVRHIGPGGQYWTERVAEALEVSHRTAEVQKRGCGPVTGTDRPSSELLRSELFALLFGALRRELTDLAGEIKRSYEYVMRCYPGQSAGDLILTGGGSLMPGLDEFLHDALGIRVAGAAAYLNRPSCRLRYSGSLREPLAVYAVSLGLVLGR